MESDSGRQGEVPALRGRQRRLPPGQYATDKFPVFTYVAAPPIDLSQWAFHLFGLVDEKTVTLDYAAFMALPKTTVVCDVHCVTRWSRFQNRWEGVSVREVLKLVRLQPEARFVMVHCYGGYTTNLPLGALLDEDALLAYRHDGEDLTLEHGGPVRLVVPKRYFWKSAKWVRGFEFLAQNQPGFWERQGYHNDADPWAEQRFGDS